MRKQLIHLTFALALVCTLYVLPAEGQPRRNVLDVFFPGFSSVSDTQVVDNDDLSFVANENDVFIPLSARQVEPTIFPAATATPSASPSPVRNSYTNPGLCSDTMEPNFGVHCKKVVDRRRLTNIGDYSENLRGIRVRVWTEYDKFRWAVNSLNGRKLRIYKLAVFVTTRRLPSTRTINDRKMEIFNNRRRRVQGLQSDTISLMPNPSKKSSGCCGAMARAFVNIIVCRGRKGSCFKKRDLVIKFKIKCKRICWNRSRNPVKMSSTRKCPACLKV